MGRACRLIHLNRDALALTDYFCNKLVDCLKPELQPKGAGRGSRPLFGGFDISATPITFWSLVISAYLYPDASLASFEIVAELFAEAVPVGLPL